ncbi:hypothetical protein BDR26DRAFT_420941 [Obelidium mucronatum]|nr:hypothetical protein BDR26DRAFT_420941 [Obelidium mucronatum]
MSSAPPPHDEDIIVFVADTGRRATLSASALRGAAGGKEDVVAVVAAALGLSAPDLIVLGLDGKAALENVSGGLMVFTKSVLSNESSSDITNSDINISMSPLPPIQTLVPLLYSTNESPSSLLDACYASFKSNVDYAKGVVASAEENARKMDELLEEQRVQSLALRIAVQSLQMHCKPACDAFDSFIAHTQKEIAKNFGLIQSFPSDLQALHRIPVHPKIASRKSSAAATANQDDDNNDGDSRFLSDYVPEEKLLLWADKCRLGHEEFVKKTMALSEVVKTLKSGSEMEASNGLDIDFETLTSQTSSAQSNLANLRQTLQLLIRDFTRVQSILQDLRNRDDHRPNNNSNYHQAQQIDQKTLTALHHLQEIHTKEYIPSLTTTATHISNLFTTLHTSKLHATSALRSRLRSISHLQTLLSNTIAPGMTRLNQNLTSMSQAFGQLLHVHRMPAAWGAAMVEIVRRREFVRVLVARAESVASGFARVGEIEKRRRETFDGEISKYLPRVVVGEKGNGLVVVQGLDEGVPKVEVRVVKGGDLLPRIGRTDVYEFEQFISQIRAAMTDVDPSSSTVPSTNQTLTSSHTSSAAGNPADSISKLQATMTKMIPQIDAVAGEFDRQLAKSGFGGGGAGGGGGDRVGKLEEENARLRAELNALKSGGGGSLARNQQASGGVGSPVPPATPSTSAPVSARKSIVAKAMSAGNFDGDWAKAEETIRAYESRIRTLEDLLQRSYHMEKSHMNNSAASLAPTDPVILQQLQNENSTLRTRLSVLESQFNTTSSSLQSYEVKLKEVRSDRENLRTLLDSERSSFQSRNAELEREISNLRNQVQEKDKEGRVVVGEVERCAGFVREVYELLDDCAGAFKVRGDSSSGGGGGCR